MKKILLLSFILIANLCLYSFTTASSTSFSNSYMQRATGVNAIYWNPANLSNLKTNAESVILPSTFSVYNNALSLDLYNDIVSQESLTVAKKNEILGKIKGSMNFDMNMNVILAGYASKNFGISLGSTVQAHGKVDKNYLKLLFFGNNYNETYTFSKNNNNTEFIVMNDLSLAYGGYSLNKLIPALSKPNIPQIRYGFTSSLLFGGGGGVDKFNGLFKASDDGMVLNQDVTLNYGGGYGFKGLFGLSSDIIKKENQLLSAGITFDNILGYFVNNISCEAREYSIKADTVYFVNMDEDFYSQKDSTYSVKSYKTVLPFKWSIGFLYKINDVSASLDISKFSKVSAFGSDKLNTAIGLEYMFFGHLPLRFGYAFGNDDQPSITSYGLGMKWKYWESGLGIQLFDSFLGQSSKGVSFALQMKFRFS